MPEMPIDQDADRFIAGSRMKDDGGLEVDLPEEMDDVEELEDGSAVVTLEDFKGPEEDEDFYGNLAETINIIDLEKVALRYLDLIEKDREAREKRDKQYEEGLKRTGLGDDAPGGAQFMGASKVVHPIMAEACVDFASRAIKEMFPPDGPTRTKILGDVTDEKTEIAERKRDYMNWQLTEQIEEFRDEQEQMLTQLPLGGSQYIKLWYDEQKARPCCEFLPIDRVYVPFSAANFYTAQRVTEVHEITTFEFKRRIASGLYKDVEIIRATMEPEIRRSKGIQQDRGQEVRGQRGRFAHGFPHLHMVGTGRRPLHQGRIRSLHPDDRRVGQRSHRFVPKLGRRRRNHDQIGLDRRVQVHSMAWSLRCWLASPDWRHFSGSDWRFEGFVGLCAHQQHRHDAQIEGRKDQRTVTAGGGDPNCGD